MDCSRMVEPRPTAAGESRFTHDDPPIRVARKVIRTAVNRPRPDRSRYQKSRTADEMSNLLSGAVEAIFPDAVSAGID